MDGYANIIIQEIKRQMSYFYSIGMTPERVIIGIDALTAVRKSILHDWIAHTHERSHVIFGLEITIDYDHRDLIQVCPEL